jgi:hypothetical protein
MNAKQLKSAGRSKQADFPEALIVNKAMRYGQWNNEDVSAVYTLDKAA